MTLKDDLRRATQEARPGPRCSLSKLLDTLTPELRDEIVDIIRDPEISLSVISRHFKGMVSEFVAGHHRSGQCKGCRAAGTFPRG